MSTGGTFTFTTGNPIQLQGFRDGAAASWPQDPDVQRRMKNEIEDMFDVFSGDAYPYEDYYKYVESGFLQGIIEAETVNDAAANWAGLKVVAELSAVYRLNLHQDVGKITASYVDVLKNHPSALTLLSKAGVAIDIEEKTELAASDDQANEAKGPQDS
jgi:hypothetical protein